MSSLRPKTTDNPLKGGNVLESSEGTSFDEEIAKSLQFMENFDIGDIEKNKATIKSLNSTIKEVQATMLNYKQIRKNMNKTKRKKHLSKKSLPMAVAAPAPSVDEKKPNFKYSDEKNEYTALERTEWENKLKADVLYEVDIPEDWVPSPIIKETGLDNSSSYSLVKLDKDGENYKRILKEYNRSSSGKNIEIYRVQNYEKLCEYNQNKKKLSKKIGEKNLNETFLYHGTQQPIDICSSGLDIRYSGQGLYGRGIYFADKSHISKKFSSGIITINRVLLGKKYSARRRSGFVQPPKGYNSVYANRDGGHEYIIYNNNYSYIEYIILDENIRGRGFAGRGSVGRGFRSGRTTGFGSNTPTNFLNTPPYNPQYLKQQQKQQTQFIYAKKIHQICLVNYTNGVNYNKKTGIWEFENLNISRNVVPSLSGLFISRLSKKVTYKTEDISNIIQYCKNYKRYNARVKRIYDRHFSKSKKLDIVKSLDECIKVAKLAYENGLKIIAGYKARAKGTKYNSLSKENLIKEIKLRNVSSAISYNVNKMKQTSFSVCDGLKNRPWLYHNRGYLKYQLVCILLMDDEIDKFMLETVKKYNNSFKIIQRKWRIKRSCV